jgi:arginyl-tRNA synthetase
VHQMLPVSKYTAIRQLVSSYLQQSLSIYTGEKNIPQVSQKDVPLYKSRNLCKVLYISGLALKLSKAYGIEALAIAEQVASHLSRNCDKQFQVTVIAPGWIHLEVTDLLVADFLQSLLEGTGSWECCADGEVENIPPISSSNPQLPISNSLFLAQYAHARCCSLLGLAKRERLLTFSDDLQISWLDNNAKLRLEHPASLRLIGILVASVDDLVCSDISDIDSFKQLESNAISLSQAFEDFWCNCRIWGDVKANFYELALARLGLVLATQKVLKFLLTDKLGISAPHEL